MGVEREVIVFKLVSQFLPKAPFFIDSRARVAKLNKVVLSVAGKLLIKQPKLKNRIIEKQQGLTSTRGGCAEGAHEKKKSLKKTPKYPIKSNDLLFFDNSQ